MTEYDNQVFSWAALIITLVTALALFGTGEFHGGFWAGVTALWIYAHIQQGKENNKLRKLTEADNK